MSTNSNPQIERYYRRYQQARAILRRALVIRNMRRAIRAANLMQALQGRMAEIGRPGYAF